MTGGTIYYNAGQGHARVLKKHLFGLPHGKSEKLKARGGLGSLSSHSWIQEQRTLRTEANVFQLLRGCS